MELRRYYNGLVASARASAPSMVEARRDLLEAYTQVYVRSQGYLPFA